MREIRIAIIGTGLISHRHMKVWSQIPGANVIDGCDIDETKLQSWGERYDISDLYTDYRKLLERDDIDAVDVCVHNNLHVPLSIAAMRAGMHCYCEKPMAGSYADAKLLYSAQEVYNRKLAVQISSIFNLQSRMARDMVAMVSRPRLLPLNRTSSLDAPASICNSLILFRGNWRPWPIFD